MMKLKYSICCGLDDFQSLGSDGAGRPQNCYFFHSFVIPFASLKAQTSYEKCCAPPLFDL